MKRFLVGLTIVVAGLLIPRIGLALDVGVRYTIELDAVGSDGTIINLAIAQLPEPTAKGRFPLPSPIFPPEQMVTTSLCLRLKIQMARWQDVQSLLLPPPAGRPSSVSLLSLRLRQECFLRLSLKQVQMTLSL